MDDSRRKASKVQIGIDNDRPARKTQVSNRTTKSISSRFSTSRQGDKADNKGVRTFQPTYRLEPQRPLCLETINRVLQRTVVVALTNQAVTQYSANRANRFCQNLSREIMQRMRAEDFDRYRSIAVVTMVEKNNQSMQQKMGFTWDTELDQWASYVVETRSFFLNAVVLWVYYE